MGEKNYVLCYWLEKPEVFADFVNGCLFGGTVKILPDDLTSIPKSYYGKRPIRKETARSVIKTRDVIKQVCRGRKYAVIAVENQDQLHYAMPFRCLEYDVADYAKQLLRIRRRHEAAGDLKSGPEYLSRMKREDKLRPVTTIVFYHGKGNWNAYRDLHSMIDFEGENELLRPYTANYRMNLVTVSDLDEDIFQTGLRELIGMMKRSNDKKAMKSYCGDHEDRFRHMDEDTYDVISVMLNHRKFRNLKTKVKNKKGELDMCQAIDEMIEDGRQDGILTGILTKTQTVAHNMFLRGMTAEDAAVICEEDLRLVENWFEEWCASCNTCK